MSSLSPVFLVVGDPHAKLSTLSEIALLKTAVLTLINERKPDFVVILGDFSDSHEKVHVQVWNAIIDFMASVSAVCHTFYIIGNHDAINNQIFLSEDHFFNAFKYFEGDSWKLTIVDKPVTWRTGVGDFALCPYVPNGRLREALDKGGIDLTSPDKIKVLFCHQEFKNAKYGPFLSERGDAWDETLPPVISGHIHERQHVGNVLYVGTPYQINFGESAEKYLHLITMSKDGFEAEAIPTQIIPKVTLTVDTTVDLNTLNPDFKYRLLVEDTIENISKFKNSKEVRNLEKAVKIIYKPTDKSTVRKNVNNDDFLSLLVNAVSAEQVTVMEVFEEVMNDVLKVK